jgi:uncharacterized protein
MDLILYHAKCTDGWCAAYVAHKKYPGARLVEAQYGVEPPYDLVAGQDVLVVDFSWKERASNIKLRLLAKSFRILDHHVSQKETLKDLEFVTFDLARSGAGLAWDCLFGWDRPWYVNYVEDYDLWRHKLPNSRAANAFLHLIPKTVEAWDEMSQMRFNDVINLGEGALMQIESNARKLVEASNPGRGWGYTVGVVNAPTWQASDVGDALSKIYDVALIWWERQDGVVTFSLRSQNSGDVNVSKIAASMGGGGHKHAAGFEVRNLLVANEVVDDILHRKGSL